MACIFLSMMTDIAIRVSTALLIALTSQSFVPKPQQVVLSSHEISLDRRHPVKSVNEVFKYNILHTLELMDAPEFVLRPGQTFAFHGDVLPPYQGSVVKTTNAHFNAQEGFRFSGFLYGDGICHLASLIYKVAKEANLDAYAPTSHDFAPIPEIEKVYGVSIYNYPGRASANSRQNLYITNDKQSPVVFKFEYKDDKLRLSVLEEN